jgi:hypothetical protein
MSAAVKDVASTTRILDRILVSFLDPTGLSNRRFILAEGWPALQRPLATGRA